MRIDSMLSIENLPRACIVECSAGGRDAGPYVEDWRKRLDLSVNRERTITCLVGYGAWERAELEAKPDEELAEIVLWLACCSFNEWDGTDDSAAGSDVFMLE